MLPADKKNASTITVLSVSLAIFFLCSWSLAAAIVEGNFGINKQDNSSPKPEPELPSLPALISTIVPESSILNPSPPESLDPPDKTREQPLFPSEPYSLQVLRGQTEPVKQVALTFDDGPDPDWTALYLDVLEEHQIPATFFFIGINIARYPHAVAEVQAHGHEIGVHSHTHRELTGLNEEQIKQDLLNSAQTLYGITQETVNYFRPPYGATNETLKDVAHGLGQTIVTWNVDPKDWQNNNPELIVAEVLRQTQPGSIILLHEGKNQTLRALPTIIQRLQQEGYEFVTVSDLFGYTPPGAIPAISQPDNPDADLK